MAGPEMHDLNQGWLELESDPGLFTLLLEQFGCKGVQVEEIYDLSNPNLIDDHVYGFIFLFKWVEERRSRHRQLSSSASSSSGLTSNSSANSNSTSIDSKTAVTVNYPCYVDDEQLVNSMFFAHQITPNSCATHSLLSVLLNCKNVHLGEHLENLRESTLLMNPENKGIAIGNIPEIAKAHNLHAAHSDLLENLDKTISSRGNGVSRASTTDSFHFVSFVAINNRVYELDGLKKSPIDHGPIAPNERFSEKFRQIILQRIPQQTNDQHYEDIRYSLMAVIPDRRKATVNKLKVLKHNRKFLIETVQTMCRPVGLPKPYDFHNYCKYPEFSCKTAFEVCTEPCSIKPNSVSTSIEPTSMDSTSELSPSSPHSTGSSTDTSSEIGSEFNSPIGSFEEDAELHFKNLLTFKFTSQPPKLDLEDVQDVNALPERNQTDSQKLNSDDLKKETSLRDLKQFNESISNSIDSDKLLCFYKKYAPKDLIRLLGKLQTEIDEAQKCLNEEEEKRAKFRLDNDRRTHDYDDFISTFLLMLTEQKKLPELLEKELRSNKNGTVKSDLNGNKDVQQLQDVASLFFEEIANEYENLNSNKNKLDLNSITINENESKIVDKKNKKPIVNESKFTNSTPIILIKTDSKTAKQTIDKIQFQSPIKVSVQPKLSPIKSDLTNKKLDSSKGDFKSNLKNDSVFVKSSLSKTLSAIDLIDEESLNNRMIRDDEEIVEDSVGPRRTNRKRTPKYTDPNYEFPGRAKRSSLG